MARKYLDNPEVRSWPPLYRDLFIWALLKASYKSGNGLERGEFETTIKEMRERGTYKVGYRIMKPTKDQIRGFYEAATKATMMTTTKTTRGLRIRILNYKEYQDPKNYEAHNEPHNEAATKPTPFNNKKEELRINNKKKNIQKEKVVETRIPEDFKLNDKMRQYATERGVANPEFEFEKFKHYWLSRDIKRLSWERTWYTWCLNNQKSNAAKQEVPFANSKQQSLEDLMK